jgi:hypothetical protein
MDFVVPTLVVLGAVLPFVAVAVGMCACLKKKHTYEAATSSAHEESLTLPLSQVRGRWAGCLRAPQGAVLPVAAPASLPRAVRGWVERVRAGYVHPTRQCVGSRAGPVSCSRGARVRTRAGGRKLSATQPLLASRRRRSSPHPLSTMPARQGRHDAPARPPAAP